MKIIIPMAGRGTRLRPHTLTIPKPLIKIAGKSIVHWLAHDLAKMSDEPLEEIAFIIGDFGIEVEKELLAIASQLGAIGKIYYQTTPLGTAHAVLCAKESLQGNIIIAFADTLFKADFQIDNQTDGMIYVQRVKDPSMYGVVTLENNGFINGFVEKPKQFVSDFAIIGIYYFKDGNALKNECQYLVDNNIAVKGEFQLTDALENMRAKGVKFIPGAVEDWLDCGNKEMTVATHRQYMEYLKSEDLISATAVIENAVINMPVFIGDNAKIINAVVGPHTSIGKNSEIRNSIVTNSIIQENTIIETANIANSMIGNFVNIKGKATDVSLGDYNQVSL